MTLGEMCDNGCNKLHEHGASFIYDGRRYNFCCMKCCLNVLKALRKETEDAETQANTQVGG